MIIGDFYVINIALPPLKADSPLIVDADAILARSISMELLQAVRRRAA
jgi:hypothetical protein